MPTPTASTRRRFRGGPAAYRRLSERFPRLLPALLAMPAGALAPLSFAPLNWWPAGLLSAAILLALLHRHGKRCAALLGWCYGLGFFGVGVSWIYVSINVYGNAGPPLAGLLTAALVAGLALLFALQCWLFQRFFLGHWTALGFAALWVLFEWLRGWLLTGFPWLYLGYGHLHTWLAGAAPVFGVLGLSFAVVLSGALLVQLYRHYRETEHIFNDHRPLLLLSLVALWAVPGLLTHIDWVETRDAEPVPVGVVQANIPQQLKFDRAFLQESLNRYDSLSAPLWNNQIILWPETAVPLLYQQAGDVLDYFGAQASEKDSSLVTGILYREDGEIHNSIVSLGSGSGVYHKQKLVPFGEYLPLEGLLRNLLEIFKLPMSSLRPGPPGQDLLRASGHALAPYICYEVVYPDFVRRSARGADFLVTISNDTWFGASWGPLQHLQMAAMRALENGRYLVRATNNGVSAIIDERGNILQRSQQFQAEVLEGQVRLFDGRTPFSRWGSWPVVIACGFIVLAILALPRLKKHR